MAREISDSSHTVTPSQSTPTRFRRRAQSPGCPVNPPVLPRRQRSCSSLRTAAAAAAAAAAGARGSHAHPGAPLPLLKSRAYWRWSGVAPSTAGASTPLHARAICVGRRGSLFSPSRRGFRRTAAGVHLLLCRKECRRLASGARCLTVQVALGLLTVRQTVLGIPPMITASRPTIARVVARTRRIRRLGSNLGSRVKTVKTK